MGKKHIEFSDMCSTLRALGLEPLDNTDPRLWEAQFAPSEPVSVSEPVCFSPVRLYALFADLPYQEDWWLQVEIATAVDQALDANDARGLADALLRASTLLEQVEELAEGQRWSTREVLGEERAELVVVPREYECVCGRTIPKELFWMVSGPSGTTPGERSTTWSTNCECGHKEEWVL